MDTEYVEPEAQDTQSEDIDDVVEVYLDLDFTTYSLLQKEAAKAGIPCPTYISNILHKYALGRVKHAM